MRVFVDGFARLSFLSLFLIKLWFTIIRSEDGELLLIRHSVSFYEALIYPVILMARGRVNGQDAVRAANLFKEGDTRERTEHYGVESRNGKKS